MGQNQAALWKAWCGLFLSRGHSQGTDPAFQMGLSNSRWTHAVTQNLEGFALLRKHGGILLHILREKGIRFIITPIVHGPFLGKGSWDDSDYPKFISVELSETGKVFPDKPLVVPAIGSYTDPPGCGFQWSVLSTAQPAEFLRSSIALPAQGPLGQNERLDLQSQWHHHKPSIVVTNDMLIAC